MTFPQSDTTSAPTRLALRALVVLCLLGLLAVPQPAGAQPPVAHDPTVPPTAMLTGLASGAGHTCGLSGTGTAWCWGQNGAGQLGTQTNTSTSAPNPTPTQVTGLPAGTTLTQLTGGQSHTCGLASDGTAYCWGDSRYGKLGTPTNNNTSTANPPAQVTGLPAGITLTHLTAGSNHTCGLASDGTAWCWGNNTYGQLGNPNNSGNSTPNPTPAQVTGLPADTSLTQLTAGRDHTCGLASDGTAFCWGENLFGQLGSTNNNGTTTANPTPATVTGLPAGTALTQITAGSAHTCGLTGDGSAFCWGNNIWGQLGNPTPGAGPTPRQVEGLPAGTTLTHLTAGSSHTCGLAGDGTTWCWGHNYSGQLGNPDNTNTNTANPTPTRVGDLPADTALTHLTTGSNHTCGLAGDGTTWCWGQNYYGQLGTTTNNGAGTANPTPAQVQGLSPGTTLTELAGGEDHTCALAGDGSTWCWGGNSLGQLGNPTTSGTFTANPTPTQVTGLPAGTTLTHLTAGAGHTCGLAGDGTAWCWGGNYYGQLGNPTNTATSNANPTPTQVTGLPAGTTLTHLTAGHSHTCGLAGDGTAYCWGNNVYGQLSTTTNNDTFIANPTPTQVTGLPAGTTLTQLTAGGQHTCGLAGDGTAYCWGSNRNGQLGNATNNGTQTANPTPAHVQGMPALTQLVADGNHTCGLAGDGTAWCWGGNSLGQLGNAPNTATPTPAQVTGLPAGTTLTQLTAGAGHTCGLAGDGTTWCWGGNSLGQLGKATNSGTHNPNPTPAQVTDLPAGTTLTWLSAGSNHTCGLAGDGTAYCWGSNRNGQLGNATNNGTQTANPTPATVDLSLAVTAADVTGQVGDTVTLAATVTGVGPANVVWQRNGSTIGSGLDLVHTVLDGDHTAVFTVTATNAFLRSATATPRLLATPTVAIDGGPHTVRRGRTIELSATGGDPDGGTVSYAWDMDDQPDFETAGQTVTFDSTGRATGDHTITVQVTDDENDTTTATTTVAVTSPPPPRPQETEEPTVGTTTDAATVDDVIQAAIDLSQARFTNGGEGGFAQDGRTADFVVLARVDVFADALGGSVLTGNAPLLYTAGDTLDPRTATEIQRVLPDGGTVHLLGGPAALDDTIDAQITDLGATPNRLAGPSRVETALAIADLAISRNGDVATVALARSTGEGTAAWADAIAYGSHAADTGAPVLLTPTDTLHPAVAEWLDAHPDLTPVGLGGTEALTDAVLDAAGATRIDGANRYATAANIAALSDATGGFTIANGTADDAWAYTLAAAGLAADRDQPVLLVDTNRLPDETDQATCATGTRADTTTIGPDRLIDATVRDALTQPCA